MDQTENLPPLEEPPYDPFFDGPPPTDSFYSEEPPYDPFYDTAPPPYEEFEGAIYTAVSNGKEIYGEINPRLTPDQRAVVDCIKGPLLVIAGPGAGKTQTLIERIINLLREGASPNSVYAVTFTNKAAHEMKNRLRDQIGDVAGSLRISTFHGLASRIYRADAYRLGLERTATFITTSQQTTLLRNIIKERGLSKTLNAYGAASAINQAKRSTRAVTTQGLIEVLIENDDDTVADIVSAYQEELTKNNRMDFGDVLLYAYRLLQIPEVQEKWAMRVKHLIADEYQDTDHLQHWIVKTLGATADSVMVVGDTDQTIYCQPEGTTVIQDTGAGREPTPIGDIKVGHRLLSSSTATLPGGGKEVIRVDRIPYQGPMIQVKAKTATSSYTPNHRCIIKLGSAYNTQRVTFLYQDTRNRYGHVITDNFTRALQRLETDLAAVWVIRAHQTEAYKGDAYTDRLTYGLTWQSAQALMRDNQIDPDAPLLASPEAIKAATRGQAFTTAAQNLRNKMLVVHYTGEEDTITSTEPLNWVSITVSTYDYTGDVISLSVADDHNYIADNILTHNSWRGADPLVLRAFKEDFPNTTVITINDNFRSSPEILNVVRHSIAPIEMPERSTLTPHQPLTYKRPVVNFYKTQVQEAEAIAAWLDDLVNNKKVDPSEIAVLYRLNRSARPIEKALHAKRNVPYVLVGDTSIYESVRVTAIVDWFRMAFWQRDALTFEHLAGNQLAAFGPKTIKTFVKEAEERFGGNIVLLMESKILEHQQMKRAETTLFLSMRYFVDKIQGILDSFHETGLQGALFAAYQSVPETFWEKRDIDPDAHSSGYNFLSTDVEAIVSKPRHKMGENEAYLVHHPVYGEGLAAWEPKQKLWEVKFFVPEMLGGEEVDLLNQDKGEVLLTVPQDVIHEVVVPDHLYKTEQHPVVDLLESMTLGSSTDGVAEDVSPVQLSTIHKAKGREFKYVWVAGVSNRSLPLEGTKSEKFTYLEPFEEERRLFFVAVSRAKEELVISGYDLAWSYAAGDYYRVGASKFLYELSEATGVVTMNAKLRPPVKQVRGKGFFNSRW